ncbi:MAG: PD40 domain-containing protein [Chloroflexi bacterium]|nr:PD40 domain-containing protein [Chloroflexota bacterium]
MNLLLPIVLLALLFVQPIQADQLARAEATFQVDTLVGRLFYTWGGALYSWLPGEAEPILHRDGGTVRGLAISPDGTKLAYTHRPDRIEAADARGDHIHVTDLWMMDLQTGESIPVAVHPIEADTPEAWSSRSAPTWSPDGSRLAYTELTTRPRELRVYDLRTGETTIVSNDLNPGWGDGGMEGPPHNVSWGGSISKIVVSSGFTLSIFDETGGVCETLLDLNGVPPQDTYPAVHDAEWVWLGDAPYLRLTYQDERPNRLLDAQSGEQFEIEADAFLARRPVPADDTPYRSARVRDGLGLARRMARAGPRTAAARFRYQPRRAAHRHRRAGSGWRNLGDHRDG